MPNRTPDVVLSTTGYPENVEPGNVVTANVEPGNVVTDKITPENSRENVPTKLDSDGILENVADSVGSKIVREDVPAPTDSERVFTENGSKDVIHDSALEITGGDNIDENTSEKAGGEKLAKNVDENASESSDNENGTKNVDENAGGENATKNVDEGGKRNVEVNPYVFKPNPQPDRSQLLALYKDELNRHWAWEDFHNGINIDKFVDMNVSNDVQQAFRVLEVHLSFLASQLQAQTLANLCDAETTAEGRAFYGVHIARVYLHIEVFGGLVNDLSDRFEREGIDPGVEETNPALAIAYKYEQLAKHAGKPVEEHELAMHAFVFNYIFNLGAVAVLRALRMRIDDECLDVWMTIHGDMLSLVRRNQVAMANCEMADIELMQTAFEVELAATLELLDGNMRADTNSFMNDMLGVLPVSARSSASMPV